MGAAARLPSSGPVALVIPGVDGVSVPGSSAGAVVRYRWPRRYKLAGLMLFARSGLATETAGLRLAMGDESSEQLTTDGQNAQTTSAFVPALALVGGASMLQALMAFAPRWHALSRVVNAGDLWMFQVRNLNAGAVVPQLAFRVEEIR